MSAGTGELSDNSDSERGLIVPVTVELLPITFSLDPSLPPNYPVQTVRVSTVASTVTVSISGIDVALSREALVRIGLELLHAAASSNGQ